MTASATMADFVPVFSSMAPNNPQRAVRQLLRDWQAAGLTYLPKPQLTPSEEVPASAQDPLMSSKSRTPKAENTAPKSSAKSPPVESAPSLVVDSGTQPALASTEQRAQALAELAKCVAGCTRCPELAATRKQTVFGVGDPQARVMFIGEAPGADEDAQGEPFVGRAGQLLNRIIEACGWRREDLYICNILRCRPPGNRTPLPEEAANCREWLDGQIRVVDPDYIVCWGSSAAQNLLGRTDPIGRMREQFFQHGRAKVLCTYHPSYLLRNPSAKKPVWEDMQRLLQEMGLEPPGKGSSV